VPYAERVSEAFLDAQDSPSRQDRMVREGQFDKDPRTGESYLNPKFRLPTDEETKQSVSDIKAFGTGLAGVVGLAVNPIAGGALSTATGSVLEHYSPSIEKWIGGSATVPVHENWTESDFWNNYQGR